jgi:hypothetical protein
MPTSASQILEFGGELVMEGLKHGWECGIGGVGLSTGFVE